MTVPRYQDLRGADLPRRRELGVEIRLLSGSSGGVSSSTLNHVRVTAIDARMADGATFEHELEAGANAFLLILEGSAIVGRQEQPVASGELAWLTRSDEAPSACDDQGRRRRDASPVLRGQPLRESVVFGGPFVMNTQEQIEEAFADSRAGRI
jgi:quercetin 2,3-dioxygenase